VFGRAAYAAATVAAILPLLGRGPNVRGALVRRYVLYPGDEDPLAMAEAAGGIVHEGWSVDTALESMAAKRGCDLDRLAPLN
jgi:hypothetical protein